MNIRHTLRKYYYRIMHDRGTPEYIARGWAIGMFFGCFIPFGIQLLLSIPTSFLLKGSKIGATLGTFVTNPVTIWVLYPLQCYVGNAIIGGNLTHRQITKAMELLIKEQSCTTLFNMSIDLILSFFIGAALLTLITVPVTYFTIFHMVKAYRNHRERKKMMKPQS